MEFAKVKVAGHPYRAMNPHRSMAEDAATIKANGAVMWK
jgi:hypothetical protein